MDTRKTRNITKTFFKAVSTGSVTDVLEILKKTKPSDQVKIANSFNTEGETPLVVAIRENHQEMVQFLVDKLKADIFKSGRFN